MNVYRYSRNFLLFRIGITWARLSWWLIKVCYKDGKFTHLASALSPPNLVLALLTSWRIRGPSASRPIKSGWEELPLYNLSKSSSADWICRGSLGGLPDAILLRTELMTWYRILLCWRHELRKGSTICWRRGKTMMDWCLVYTYVHLHLSRVGKPNKN